jgi:Nucleotidyl transferase AbiEii toxin, Type IV TA system
MPSPHQPSSHLRYASPAALRAALKARLTALAAADPARPLPQLQRQFAYDRLLARVFRTPDADLWVLKGAGALLARLHTARHSIDIDLYRRQDDLPAAEQALRSAARLDLGDYFAFDLGSARTLQQAGVVRRIPVTASLGAAEYTRFHVDLIAGIVMTGQPDNAAPMVDVDLPGLVQATYLVYPLADHVADKVAAIHETHARADGAMVASTRVKDLVDLILIATSQRVDAAALRTAIRSEEVRRGLTLPATVTVPAAPVWDETYSRFASELPALANYPTLASATGLARALLDPILTDHAAGIWNPDRVAWEDVEATR